jgi:hypothetical protein
MALRSRAKGRHGGLHQEKERRQGWDEADDAKRIPEYCSANVDQKWNEGWLVDVSPGQMIPAGDVVELVAKISVAVVEVDVEQKFGEGDGPDDRHAAGEKRFVAAGGSGKL